MHLQVNQEYYGIFMIGERVVCLYIALLCMIMVQLDGNPQCWAIGYTVTGSGYLRSFSLRRLKKNKALDRYVPDGKITEI